MERVGIVLFKKQHSFFEFTQKRKKFISLFEFLHQHCMVTRKYDINTNVEVKRKKQKLLLRLESCF